MGLFDSFLEKQKESRLMMNYSEKNIKKIIAQYEGKIFEVVGQTKEFYGLTGFRKLYAEEYLHYVCFITAGAILLHKLNKLGFPKEDQECKIVVRAVIYNSLNFCKKYILTGLIDYPLKFDTFNNEEDLFLLQVMIELEKYSKSLADFLNSGELYVEALEDYEEHGEYIRKVHYRFIQETHQIKFEETKNGISLKKFDDFDNDFAQSNTATLNCIKALADS